MAWLNTSPNKATDDKSTTSEPTRRERLKAEGVDVPELPPCSATYLADYLFEIGPTAPAGMAGESPLPHTEIAAWQSNTGIRLSAWEARTLRLLSMAYVSELRRAKERNCLAPWNSADAQIDKLVQANAQKNAFRQLAKL